MLPYFGEVKIGSIYKLFKNKYYIVIDIVNDCENDKKIVIYKALYGDNITWASDYESFISEVDHEKYPSIVQKYRFEEIEFNNSYKEDIIKYNELRNKISKYLTEELKKIDKD